jgi:hypothetical protein
MDQIGTLGALGISLPTPAYLAGAILFSIIGFAAYRYGKKASLPAFKWLGIALMLYSYVAPETWMVYTIGIALCAALYFFRS